jgi:hypothetical protein
MATRSHRNMIKQCNETSYTCTVVGPLFRHYYRTIYNTLLTHTTPKTAINVMTATFNSVHNRTIKLSATYHAALRTKDYYRKYLIHRGFEPSGVLFIQTNAHTYIKILNYMTKAPTCLRALHHLHGVLILRLLKL